MVSGVFTRLETRESTNDIFVRQQDFDDFWTSHGGILIAEIPPGTPDEWQGEVSPDASVDLNVMMVAIDRLKADLGRTPTNQELDALVRQLSHRVPPKPKHKPPAEDPFDDDLGYEPFQDDGLDIFGSYNLKRDGFKRCAGKGCKLEAGTGIEPV